MSRSAKELIFSFPPVSDSNSAVLILGSMPGKESLKQNCYYAHTQNAFWKIMGELVGAHPYMPYGERLLRLTGARLALWDVLASCVRESSLDTDIRREKANNFAAFFALHP